MTARERLKEANRIVVKVGTSTLTHASGGLNLRRIDLLLRELSDLMNAGKEIVFVSSGAIAAGMGRLGLAEKPAEIPKKQAIAAVGQGVLMHIYEKFFAEYGKTMGQVLLTKENAVRHHQYSHSRDALLALLAMGAVPVINENDAVSVDEIKIGDNDNLSAIVATLVDADALVILSDIEGVYTANPAAHADARLIEEIAELTPTVMALAGSAGSKLGTGGMVTKLEAAYSPKTKAVMIAHTLGNPFDLKAVKRFCDAHGLWLIEDNCDALGSRYTLDGVTQFTGTVGDIGTSSFYDHGRGRRGLHEECSVA